MTRKPCPDNPPCPRCGATHVVKNGSKNGRQRWGCRTCNRSFGATFGTPMYRLHNTPTEVARTLLVVMRRGSLSAAEEITGHKYETIGRWLRAAAQHAEQITEALVRDLHWTVVEVDAFWSFVKKSASPNDAPAETGPRWGCLLAPRALWWRGRLRVQRMWQPRRWWRRRGDGQRDTGAYRGSVMDGRSIGRKLGGCIGMRSVWASVGVRAEYLRLAWA